MIIEITEKIYIFLGKDPQITEKNFEIQGKTIYYDDIGVSANVNNVLESLNNEKTIFVIGILDYFFGIYKE